MQYLARSAQSDFECHLADAVGCPLGDETCCTGFLTVFADSEILLLHILRGNAEVSRMDVEKVQVSGVTYQAFGVFAYDYEVDRRLVLRIGRHLFDYEAACVCRYGRTYGEDRPNIGIQVQFLAQCDDGRRVACHLLDGRARVLSDLPHAKHMHSPTHLTAPNSAQSQSLRALSLVNKRLNG